MRNENEPEPFDFQDATEAVKAPVKECGSGK
jgi:hypothetical protein